MEITDIAAFEKHIQTVIGITVIGLIGWAGSSLTDLQEQAAVSSTEITSIKEDVGQITHGDGGVYTRNQAKEDWSINRNNIRMLDSRIRRIESNPDLVVNGL